MTTHVVQNETTTVVGSEITRVSTGDAIELDWVVAKTPTSYKVVDITAGGMSLSREQREEFSSVVHRNGDNVSNLIGQLHMKWAIDCAQEDVSQRTGTARVAEPSSSLCLLDGAVRRLGSCTAPPTICRPAIGSALEREYRFRSRT